MPAVKVGESTHAALVEIARRRGITLGQAVDLVLGYRADDRTVLNVSDKTHRGLARIAAQRGLTIGRALDLVLGGIAWPGPKTCSRREPIASGEV